MARGPSLGRKMAAVLGAQLRTESRIKQTARKVLLTRAEKASKSKANALLLRLWGR